MKFLKGLFGGEKKAKGSQSSGFDNMLPPDPNKEAREAKEAEAARHQRKILAAYAAPDLNGIHDVLSMNDVDVNSQQRHDILNLVATGQTESMKKDILSMLAGPMDYENSSEKVLDSLADIDRMILTGMTRGTIAAYKQADKSDIVAFKRDFATPIDFEENTEAFLNDVEKRYYDDARRRQKMDENESAKYARRQCGYFESALGGFEAKMYGEKKLQYLEQMKQLDYEADVLYDQEHSYEWVPGQSGYWQSSKSQVAGGLVTREKIERGECWADNTCQDAIFYDPTKQLYAVFDGVGGAENGRFAANSCANTLAAMSEKYPKMSSCSSLALALNEASRVLLEEKRANGLSDEAGYSTGVIAKVENLNGQRKISFASVGDSRIYIIDFRGHAHQITKDEGEGRIIRNSLGRPLGPGESGVCEQFGMVDWKAEYRSVAIVSDGVPGDRVVVDNQGHTDELTSKEIGQIAKLSHGCQDAAANLVARARKIDDRSAIVFVPDFDRL